MLYVTAPQDPGEVTVRARFEPAEVKLMEPVTLVVEAPGLELSLDDVTLPDLSGLARSGGHEDVERLRGHLRAGGHRARQP